MKGGQAERGTLSTRDKLILTGLYLSKFDVLGLQKLGFSGFFEAYNAIGYALDSKPLSIRGYRDEFDPLFPNSRKGRHKREPREYCLEILNRFQPLDFESFTALIQSFFATSETAPDPIIRHERQNNGPSSFAQRLITGMAAERYFESVRPQLAQFRDFDLENTTTHGCGYDFRLRTGPQDDNFLAVEVKGLSQPAGNVTMTAKEYDVASSLKDRFFLFIVRNFRESPTHEIFRNPLSSGLIFQRVEQVIVQVTWLTSV